MKKGFLFCYVGGFVWEYFVEGVNVFELLLCDCYDMCDIWFDCLQVIDFELLKLECWLMVLSDVSVSLLIVYVNVGNDQFGCGWLDVVLGYFVKVQSVVLDDELVLVVVLYVELIKGECVGVEVLVVWVLKVYLGSGVICIVVVQVLWYSGYLQVEVLVQLGQGCDKFFGDDVFCVNLELVDGVCCLGCVDEVLVCYVDVFVYQVDSFEGFWGQVQMLVFVGCWDEVFKVYVDVLCLCMGFVLLCVDYLCDLLLVGYVDEVWVQLKEVMLFDV